ncbi:MAG: deoxyribose-phosphate aldolase [Deltaproteobacteria bacterium]|nr:deoxyribose-phosphate aldolase [Deltaproteobacteria bacterium]
MTLEELANRIDCSLLRPDATKRDFEKLLERAIKFPFASLCVPPSYAGFISKLLKARLKVCAVVGFPLGYQTKGAKVFEAMEAVQNGAGEIDMVMNISAFKSGEFIAVEEEIRAIVSALPRTVVKVIIETCYLTDREKVLAVEAIVRAGAHFVKTSTGFGPKGATLGDVRLLKEAARGRIKVKAAGGIKTLKHALTMLGAGADRLGTSHGIEMVEGYRTSALP